MKTLQGVLNWMQRNDPNGGYDIPADRVTPDELSQIGSILGLWWVDDPLNDTLREALELVNHYTDPRNMGDFLLCEGEDLSSPRWINRRNIVSLDVTPAFENGRPLAGLFWVRATLDGYGTALLHCDSMDGCMIYLRNNF